MKKRLPLLLALCLLLTVPALAAENSMGNFVRSKTYGQQFSDLTADSVFYSNVSALYEYGLSVGKADGTFGLNDSLTVGQAVIFAGRIRSLYRTGDPELGPAAYRTEGQAVAVPIFSTSRRRVFWARSWTGSLPTPPPGPRWPMCWRTSCLSRRCRPSTVSW